MGDRSEIEKVWTDLEETLEKKGYSVEFGGSKKNEEGGFRYYGTVE